MRQLTFKGFLKRYLKILSGHNGINLRLLLVHAESTNVRLREPLFLYMMAVGKKQQFLEFAYGKEVFSELINVANAYDWQSLNHALESNDANLPIQLQKVHDSYRVKRDWKEGENHSKFLMWNRITALKKEKGISNYRIYKDLELNPGNINAYLKHGDPSKLSLATARRTLEYLETA